MPDIHKNAVQALFDAHGLPRLTSMEEYCQVVSEPTSRLMADEWPDSYIFMDVPFLLERNPWNGGHPYGMGDAPK
jgi:hypothetical protein